MQTTHERGTDEISTDSYWHRDSRHSVADRRSSAEEKEDPGRCASDRECSGGHKHTGYPSSIRFDGNQKGTRNAFGSAGHPEVLRNRDELGGRQDLGRSISNRAGSTSKSNYPRTGRLSFAAKISDSNDAVSGT